MKEIEMRIETSSLTEGGIAVNCRIASAVIEELPSHSPPSVSFSQMSFTYAKQRRTSRYVLYSLRLDSDCTSSGFYMNPN